MGVIRMIIRAPLKYEHQIQEVLNEVKFLFKDLKKERRKFYFDPHNRKEKSKPAILFDLKISVETKKSSKALADLISSRLQYNIRLPEKFEKTSIDKITHIELFPRQPLCYYIEIWGEGDWDWRTETISSNLDAHPDPI